MTDHEYRDTGMSTATFLVEVDGVDIGRYTEVSGLEVSVEVHTYNEGGVNGHVHQLPGRMTWPNIVLKRGVTFDDKLLEWFHETSGEGFATAGKVARATAAISLISKKGKRLRSWDLIDAIPVRWVGPTLAGSTADAPSEELEVAHHGFKATSFK
ncbi:MAG: phage tail-like protein [Glaciecola sp.]|jgi:phage tail-like protein